MEKRSIEFLQMMFVKNYPFDESYLSENLYISYDSVSAIKYDYKNVVNVTKKYNSLEVSKITSKELQEGYIEVKAFFSVKDDINYYNFVRIIYSDERIMDVLVYNLGDSKNINKVNEKQTYYANIFFKDNNKYKFDDKELKKIEDLVDDRNYVVGYLDNEMFKIIKADDDFYGIISYEEYDYENKYQNYLDAILSKDVSVLFHKALLNDDKFKLKLYQKDKSVIYMDLLINRLEYNKNPYYVLIIE